VIVMCLLGEDWIESCEYLHKQEFSNSRDKHLGMSSS